MDCGLYVVATPIGNLDDISRRALDVLGAVDLIAAEDTRHSARLLQHYGITTPALAYHEHSAAGDTERLLQCLEAGGSVALVCDAGTPLVSDPGYRLVRAAQERGVAVHPVPGACAAVAALSACGLPTDRFLFEGFLPARQAARSRRLAELAGQPATLVFYEAPHRVCETLADMAAVLGGEREAALAREITKRFETLRRGTLSELAAFVAGDDNQQRGEIVLLVTGRPDEPGDLTPALETLLLQLAEELPPKKAAALVAGFSGLRKNALYEFLLARKQTE